MYVRTLDIWGLGKYGSVLGSAAVPCRTELFREGSIVLYVRALFSFMLYMRMYMSAGAAGVMN